MILTFPFTTPANYTPVNAEVSTGFGRLDLIPKPSLLFSQGFDASAGFTFDSAKTEFAVGLMRQKDRTGGVHLISANYDVDADLNWSKVGTLVADVNGVPTFVGGKMVCTGAQGANYDASASGSFETHKFKYTPNYTGGPPDNVNLFTVYNGSNNNNRFHLTHSPAGNTLRLSLWDATGNVVIAIATAFGSAYLPTAGVENEFLILIDPGSNFVRVWIDGIIKFTASPGAFTRVNEASRMHVGATTVLYDRAEASFDDYVFRNSVQETANYTPGYVTVPSIYGTDPVDLPNFLYITAGSVQSLDSLAITEVGDVRYTFEGQWFNGSIWVVSDGSFAQANTLADVNTNIGTLDVAGQTTISMQVVFDDVNIAASVDAAVLTYTGQEYPLNGSLLTNSPFVAQTVLTFDAIANIPVNTEIRYIFNVNGQDRWHNGVDFADSDGTAAESNTLAEVQAVIATAIADNSTLKIKVLLITIDQQVTPEIDSMTVDFNFGAFEPPTPLQAQVFGFIKDPENNPISGATVRVKPARDGSEYTEAGSRVIVTEVSRVTNGAGFFAFNLITSSQFESADGVNFQYVLTIELASGKVLENDGDEIFFIVPDVASVNITDQIKAV